MPMKEAVRLRFLFKPGTVKVVLLISMTSAPRPVLATVKSPSIWVPRLTSWK